MPWQEVSVMDQRLEFVRLAQQEGANRTELCRRFGISRQVGYKWLGRFAAGTGALKDRSRRPHTSPQRTTTEIEARVLAVRDAHPAWGGRKIMHYLKRAGHEVPAASTVHAILRRHDRILPAAGGARASLRFEKEAPNLLWQMDFKGHVPLAGGGRCHPLTVLDDHSRYCLCVQACGNEQEATVQGHVEATFRRHGLPDAIYVDNGSPWGDSSGARWTRFGVWLLKLGVAVVHSRPYHPQGRGKNERFHRTLLDEVVEFATFHSLPDAQRAFDAWRNVYNFERPHEGIDYAVPGNRYTASLRPMPDRLPQLEYGGHEIVRTISTTKAYIAFKGRTWKVPQAFMGERVAIRPRLPDGHYAICFGAHEIARIDLTEAKTVSHVPEHLSAMSPG
jgi:transposase InsO family protein